MAIASVAHADVIIGSTFEPTGSAIGSCLGGTSGQDVSFQYTQASATSYTVPAGNTTIYSWSTNTTSDASGEPLTLVVLRPTAGKYLVVAADTETLPDPLPAVATFELTAPIVAQAGDVLGLYSSSTSPTCYFAGGGVSGLNRLNALDEPSPPPSAGQTLSIDGTVGESPLPSELDVSADLSPTVEDAGVTTTAEPSTATAGRPAFLSSTVTDHGPGVGPITFVDNIPAGLTVDDVVVGAGTCSSSGQTVTCAIGGLAPGQSASVVDIVTPTAAGTYNNSVSVAVGRAAVDPTPSNNTAAATLAVGAGPVVPTKMCVVPVLNNTPAGVAKTVLRDLGCKTRTTGTHSTRVRKGLVIATEPRAGKYPFGELVTVSVSAGPKRHKKHKKHVVREAPLVGPWIPAPLSLASSRLLR